MPKQRNEQGKIKKSKFKKENIVLHLLNFDFLLLNYTILTK